jgi:di/tricarboxylate transporter
MDHDGVSLAAWMSILALVVVVALSAVRPRIHVGFLSIALAIVVGAVFLDLAAVDVLAGFPLDLVMVLVGVTFLFAIAQVNGTLEKLTTHAVRRCRGNLLLIPLLIYTLALVITTIGPGNIAAVALLAPLAMALAGRVGMPAFGMTLLVVGAANSAAFSPFAPTGIVSHGLIADMAPGIPDLHDEYPPQALDWKIYLNSVLAQGIVVIPGFLVFGGWAWLRRHRGERVDVEALAPTPEPLDNRQRATVAAIAALVILVVVPALPGVAPHVPAWLALMTSNVGTVAFVLAGLLMLADAADAHAAVAAMPWFVIMMIAGVTVLIQVMAAAGGLDAITTAIAAFSGPVTVTFWLGLVTGVISAYSSSSGVVMPAFLPLVPGLLEQIPGADPIAMITSINVGSHLVDASPLSTLGALCIACAAVIEDKDRLFRHLLAWGLSMSVVGAIICLVLFGVLGL